jgi:hypothetical protein
MGMTRFFRCSLGLLVAVVAALPAVPVAAVTPAQAARLCAGKGYQGFVRQDGSGFPNPGACVNYAVQTGTLNEVLDAHSVLSIVGGGAGCIGPDSNGDLTCTEGAGGCISGAFNTPATNCEDIAGFSYTNNYLWHSDGSASGSGIAVCTACVVAGLTGDVNFVTTGVGQGPQSLDNALILSGGTWSISSATGQLVGLSGSGRWSVDFSNLHHIYDGTISLAV